MKKGLSEEEKKLHEERIVDLIIKAGKNGTVFFTLFMNVLNAKDRRVPFALLLAYIQPPNMSKEDFAYISAQGGDEYAMLKAIVERYHDSPERLAVSDRMSKTRPNPLRNDDPRKEAVFALAAKHDVTSFVTDAYAAANWKDAHHIVYTLMEHCRNRLGNEAMSKYFEVEPGFDLCAHVEVILKALEK